MFRVLLQSKIAALKATGVDSVRPAVARPACQTMLNAARITNIVLREPAAPIHFPVIVQVRFQFVVGFF
jgi:hypothetical protein